MSTYLYSPAVESDMPALARLIHLAFAGPMEGCEKWLKDVSIPNIRIMRSATDGSSRVPGCHVRIPMGQYFGGQRVTMLGIAGVAVGPEFRGLGIAASMMAEAMREGERDGFAISTLYASTLGLYRKVGYEVAGHRFETSLPVGRIDPRDADSGSGPMRALEERDEPAVRACFQRFAQAFDGNLDRGEYCWKRTREMREGRYLGFGVPAEDGSDALSGYIFLTQQRDAKTGFQDLAISDVAFATPAAAKRLLGFISDFASMAEQARLYGGPLHPLLAGLNSRHFSVEKRDFWMTRILSVPRALEQRGYSRAVSATLGLRVSDPIVPSNAGLWELSVADGRGSVRRLGDADSSVGVPTLTLGIRGLAPLFSGLYRARELALMGWLGGDPGAIAAAEAIFAGGTPWMTDMF